LNFEGVPLSPGATVQVSVPLSAEERAYVAEGGNAVPPYTVAVLAVPVALAVPGAATGWDSSVPPGASFFLLGFALAAVIPTADAAR
jgi:hypothetical protein